MGVSIAFQSVTFGYSTAFALFEGATVAFVPEAPRPGRGFITAVMGASGSGKTTALKLLLGELIPRTGTVTVVPQEERASYLAQEPIIFDHLSIKENARYFSLLRSTRGYFDEKLFQTVAQELRLNEILERKSTINRLSGGERQRIALLRALSIRPKLLLLDEPCRGLDVPVRHEFLLYLRRFSDLLGLAVIYVTHQQSEARILADRIVFFVRQSNAAVAAHAGTIAELTNAPPTESIAHTLSREAMNRLPVADNSGTLAVENSSWQFVASTPVSRALKGIVVFGASQVRWLERGGIPCRHVSETGEYSLAALNGAPDCIITGPSQVRPLGGFKVDGESMLFDVHGTFLSKGQLVEKR